jgi:tRNA A37 threonylcarbamoyladenosine modification protein TsaB
MPERFILLLDTRDRAVAFVGIAQSKKVIRIRRIPILGATHKILSTVRMLTTPSSISGIVVAQGPGSFTAVRMGVVVANALAFGLGVPIAGVRLPITLIPSRDSLNRLANVRPLRRGVVLPLYTKPPSITPRKKRR